MEALLYSSVQYVRLDTRFYLDKKWSFFSRVFLEVFFIFFQGLIFRCSFLSYLRTRLNHLQLCVTADASTSRRCLPVYLPQSEVSHKAASGQHPAGQMNSRQLRSRSSTDYLTWHQLCQPLRLLLLVFAWTILTPFSVSTTFTILG